MPFFNVKTSRWSGKSPFDPRGRNEVRTFKFEAKDKYEVHEQFNLAISDKESGVVDEFGEFKIDSITNEG